MNSSRKAVFYLVRPPEFIPFNPHDGHLNSFPTTLRTEGEHTLLKVVSDLPRCTTGRARPHIYARKHTLNTCTKNFPGLNAHPELVATLGACPPFYSKFYICSLSWQRVMLETHFLTADVVATPIQPNQGLGSTGLETSNGSSLPPTTQKKKSSFPASTLWL